MVFVLDPGVGRYVPDVLGSSEPPNQSLPYVIVRPIGYDGAIDSAYFLEVILDVSPGLGAEFSFCVTEHDANGDERRFWRSRDLANVIPRGARPSIVTELGWLCFAIAMIAKPPEFSMFTFEADLPDKALKKYKIMCGQFESAGYNITSEEYHGRKIWRMVRQNSAPDLEMPK